ncbi:hypothetical protein E2562_033731, partial [Oryza meyeriana var. granulata]
NRRPKSPPCLASVLQSAAVTPLLFRPQVEPSRQRRRRTSRSQPTKGIGLRSPKRGDRPSSSISPAELRHGRSSSTNPAARCTTVAVGSIRRRRCCSDPSGPLATPDSDNSEYVEQEPEVECDHSLQQ